MISPRIWIGCAVGENAQQGVVALAQQLTNDLRQAGAEVISESFALPDEQFLPVLQQELASCQWFVLVQTPQGMGSGRTQLALQEAISRFKGGLLRGVCLVNASSNEWDGPPTWSEMKSYVYNGDYPRLRDKLLLDLGLLQITGFLGEGMDDATVGMLPPFQQAPGFQPQYRGSTERPAPFQERSEELYKSSSAFQIPASQIPASSGDLQQTGNMASKGGTRQGDRPVVPPLFSIPKPSMPSRRFWLFSLVSVLCVGLIVSGAVLAKNIAPTPSPAVHSKSITLAHPAPTHVAPTPTATPTPIPTPTPTPIPTSTPLQPPLNAVYACGALRSDGGKNWTVVGGGLNPPSCNNGGYFSYTSTPTSLFALFENNMPVPAQSQFVDIWIYIPVSPYASADANYTLSFTCSSNTPMPSATWQRIESQQQGWVVLDTSYQLPACSGNLSLTLKISSDESDQAYLAEDDAALYFH
jgi:hypothetical protein